MCIWGGREDSIREYLLSEGQWWILNYQTFNDKVECQKGNSPEQVFKVPKLLLSEIKEVVFEYNQEIGLGAAIFWRPRNRALVYCKLMYINLYKLKAPKI